jgi:hypothetical protein
VGNGSNLTVHVASGTTEALLASSLESVQVASSSPYGSTGNAWQRWPPVGYLSISTYPAAPNKKPYIGKFRTTAELTINATAHRPHLGKQGSSLFLPFTVFVMPDTATGRGPFVVVPAPNSLA